LPKWTEGTVLALRKVLTFLGRAVHVVLTHRHRLDTVLEEEVLHLLPDFRIGHHLCRHPPHQDRLCTNVKDHAGGNLGGGLVVRTVQGHSANRELGLLRSRCLAQVVLDALAVAAVLVLLAAAARTGSIAGELLAGHGSSLGGAYVSLVILAAAE